MQTLIRVIFYPTQNAQQKMDAICACARDHFDKGHQLLFYGDNDQSIEFVDKLLWKAPPQSFLPHSIDSEDQELLSLTRSLDNSNGASALFNLSSHPIQKPHIAITTLYEFEDTTSPQKQTASKEKLEFYKSQHYHIIQK